MVALIIGDRRWEARGGERGVIYDIALWAVPFGLIGARLYHVITDWPTYFGEGDAGLIGVLRIWDGGLGIWGAVALGGVGAWIGCRRRGIPLPAFADAIAPGIVLAQAIGRIGNYFNQELYGRPTTLPWGLEIYERRDASGALDPLNGVSTGQPLIPGVEAVHPTFLYESLWNLLVFAALIYIDRRFKIGHGRLFAMYVAGYCFGRFWIELLRVDEARLIDGIRVNSFTSMFVFIGAVVYIMVAPKGREDPATLRGKPEEAEEEEAEEEEDTSVEEFVKELTAVAATTGVVAAAKVAGKEEDEDARAVGDVTEESEAAAEAEAWARSRRSPGDQPRRSRLSLRMNPSQWSPRLWSPMLRSPKPWRWRATRPQKTRPQNPSPRRRPRPKRLPRKSPKLRPRTSSRPRSSPPRVRKPRPRPKPKPRWAQRKPRQPRSRLSLRMNPSQWSPRLWSPMLRSPKPWRWQATRPQKTRPQNQSPRRRPRPKRLPKI